MEAEAYSVGRGSGTAAGTPEGGQESAGTGDSGDAESAGQQESGHPQPATYRYRSPCSALWKNLKIQEKCKDISKDCNFIKILKYIWPNSMFYFLFY